MWQLCDNCSIFVEVTDRFLRRQVRNQTISYQSSYARVVVVRSEIRISTEDPNKVQNLFLLRVCSRRHFSRILSTTDGFILSWWKFIMISKGTRAVWKQALICRYSWENYAIPRCIQMMIRMHTHAVSWWRREENWAGETHKIVGLR